MRRGEIRFVRRRATALGYEVLAHLDLGRDAANLFEPTRRIDAGWVEPLRRAYLAAPSRLFLQAIPLLAEEYESLPETTLRVWRSPTAREDAMLLEHWIEAVEHVEGEPVWSGVPEGLAEALRGLRAVLWERRGEPPPLEVFDAPALGPAGRGASVEGRRRVAVDLGQSFEHALCQIFHEEVHPISDTLVPGDDITRDTAVDAEGFARHRALERMALEVGQAVLEARAPEWLTAYQAWRVRWAM